MLADAFEVCVLGVCAAVAIGGLEPKIPRIWQRVVSEVWDVKPLT